MARILNWIVPTYTFGIPNPNKTNYRKHFFSDKLYLGEKICAHNVMLSNDVLKNLHEAYIPNFTSSLFTIKCELDKNVSNQAIEKFHSECKSEDKTIRNYNQVDHEISMDADFWPTMVKDIVFWQNTRI
jgi:esterase/lipase